MCLVAIRAGASKKRIQAELGITSQAFLAEAREGAGGGVGAMKARTLKEVVEHIYAHTRIEGGCRVATWRRKLPTDYWYGVLPEAVVSRPPAGRAPPPWPLSEGAADPPPMRSWAPGLRDGLASGVRDRGGERRRPDSTSKDQPRGGIEMSTTNEQGPEPGADLVAAARGVEPEGEAAWTPPPPPAPEGEGGAEGRPEAEGGAPGPRGRADGAGGGGCGPRGRTQLRRRSSGRLPRAPRGRRAPGRTVPGAPHEGGEGAVGVQAGLQSWRLEGGSRGVAVLASERFQLPPGRRVPASKCQRLAF